MDLDAIARVIAGEQAAFQACYAQGRAREPHLTGRVVVRLIIAADGSVAEVEDVSFARAGVQSQGRPSASGALPDLEVRACIAAVYARLKLPGGPATIHWPMYFSPDKRQEVSEELR